MKMKLFHNKINNELIDEENLEDMLLECRNEIKLLLSPTIEY